MSAIEAASVSVRTLADNTLRLTVDIEPRFAQDAFRLFGQAGTAMALAALMPASTHAEPPTAQPEPARRELGPICYWLVQRCKEPEFQAWIDAGSPIGAAEKVRAILDIKSRADVDGNEEAEALYHKKIRGPYSKFLAARGST